MKSRITIAILALAVVALLIDKFYGGEGKGPPAPPLPQTRVIDVHDVMTYAEMTSKTFRVRTTRDVLPGGYSAAMVPILVDWDHSDLSGDGGVIIRNINDRGNPVSGVTTLRSARIYPRKIKAAEFIMVPLGGPRKISHGQLRFVFDEGGAEFLDREDTLGEPDVLEDLVLSWEAWRSPGVDFNMLKGMAPGSFELTLRGYSGRQRFLEDALGSRDWYAYTLQLPGGRDGLTELLRIALVIGDGAGRHSISRLLEEADDEWLRSGPDSDEAGNALEEWRGVEAMVRDEQSDMDDPRVDMTGKTGYQTLLRSCASMALYTVNVAVIRLIESGNAHANMRAVEMPGLMDEPEWMSQLAGSSVAGMFVRAPSVILYIRANPVTIPGNIPGELDRAGLLLRQDGKAVERHYSMAHETPWGHRDHLLIR